MNKRFERSRFDGSMVVPYALGGLMVLVVLALVLALVEALCFSTTVTLYGTVLDKQYEPSHHTTGTAYGTDSKGRTTTSQTTNYESEKWTVVLETEGGEVQTMRASAARYYQVKHGQRVPYRVTVGKLTNIAYSKELG
jgi:hypothetical protein